MNDNQWNQLGWHGLSFAKPKNWELGKLEGNENKGYLRLDNHIASRMELRWQKQFNISLDKVLAKYVRGLERKAKQQKTNLKFTHKRDYRTEGIGGKYFIWEADSKHRANDIDVGVNVVAQCKKSSRLLVACVFGKQGEHIEEKAEKIFSSLKDHEGSQKMFWSIFDFSFTTPGELRLNSHRFLSGHLRLDFSRGENSFVFERLSVANILLKEKSLTQWAIEFCGSQFKNVEIEVSYPREGDSEQGIYTIGRERHDKIRFLKKRFFKSLFWHCQKTNHILGAAELVKKKEESYLDKLVSGVKCH